MKKIICNTFVLIAIFTFFSSCSSDGINIPSVPDKLAIIIPSKINFVRENGVVLTSDDCINPIERYNVLIETVAEGDGDFKPTKIEYTVNGVSYSMTFMSPGNQINAVSFVNGLNIAQLVETGFTAKINYLVQSDFELVE